MVGVLQNLNGSRDLTTPLSRIVCHFWAAYLLTKFGVSIPPTRRCENGFKMWKMGWFGVIRGNPISFNIAPFDTANTSFY